MRAKRPRQPRTEMPVEMRLEVWKPVFTAELAALIRQHGIEAETNYPASLLADYFLCCINMLEYMDTRRVSFQRTGWQPVAVSQEEA